MNFSQEELAELQKINAVTDAELGTRKTTTAEIRAFESTLNELWEQGFAVTKDNFLKLWLAFDGAASQVPITRETIFHTTEMFRDKFQWKDQAEVDYNKLSTHLGKQNSDLLWGYMDGHRLEATYSNFNSCARFFLANHWGLESRAQFTRLLGNLQNSRQHQYGEALTWKPTPDEARRQKEIEQQKATTTLRKISPEEKARAISHLAANDPGAVRQIDPESPLGRHQAAVHAAMKETERQIAQEQDPTEAYFGQRTTEFIASIPSTNDQTLAQEHVQKLRAQGMNWSRVLVNVDNFYNRLKTNRWQSQQRG